MPMATGPLCCARGEKPVKGEKGEEGGKGGKGVKRPHAKALRRKGEGSWFWVSSDGEKLLFLFDK